MNPMEKATNAVHEEFQRGWDTSDREVAKAVFASIDNAALGAEIAQHGLVGGPTIECKCGWVPDWECQTFVGWIAQFDTHRSDAIIAWLTCES